MRALSAGGTAARFGLIGSVAAALALLAACGPADENSMSAAFDKNFHSSCVTSATGTGAPASAADAYCTCAQQQLDKVPTMQRLDPTNINNAKTTCLAALQGGGGAGGAGGNAMDAGAGPMAPPTNAAGQ